VDVLYVEEAAHGYAEHHRALLANARAQVEALSSSDPHSLAVNAVSALTLDRLTPERLGSLMALYEHKVVMVAALLGINAFDQPGVELGKELARRIERDDS
jgi:glucose-6-phosphate isomerase